jgi:two-component system response regulator AtoC
VKGKGLEEKMKNITLVDDEQEVLKLLQDALDQPGRKLHAYNDPLKALDGLPKHGADLIVTDLDMPGMSGMEFLKTCRGRFPDAKIVILTGHGGVKEAVRAMKEGATDFFTKPLGISELAQNIGKLLDLQEAARNTRTMQTAMFAVGGERSMAQSLRLAETVAKGDTTVLITGETGTGKEVLADFIQGHSARAKQPYVKVNCAALPESLIESELFGHEKGAFTGASDQRVGRFERAHQGTLFLDEAAELPLAMQVKLLRVLQSHEIERVGGAAAIRVDFRLLCATNRDLQALTREGKFREDLFYRISVFPINVPPLRERPQDVLMLAREFLRRAGKAIGKGPLSLSREAEAVLTAYPWPGNVRELENVIERAAIMAAALVLEAGDFWWLIAQAAPKPGNAIAPAPAQAAPPTSTGGQAATPTELLNPLEEAERQTLLTILQRNKWNFSRAAEDLKMSRSTLYAKAGRYGIKR